jgi:hypothetical protein
LEAAAKLQLLSQRFPTLLNKFEAYNAAVLGSPTTPKRADDASMWGFAADEDPANWDPVLIISNKHISIDQLKLTVENSSLSWLVNLLAGIFGEVIKSYVCVQLSNSLVSGSSALLSQVNGVMSEHWKTVTQVLGMQSVVGSVNVKKADVEDLYSLCGYGGPLSGIEGASGDSPSKYERTEVLSLYVLLTGLCCMFRLSREHVLKFVEDTPIGLKLDIQKTAGATLFHSNSDKLFVLGKDRRSRCASVPLILHFVRGRCDPRVAGSSAHQQDEYRAPLF